MGFNYTTELRTFFENLPVNADQSLPHAQVIENGRTKLFDFDYPIFDPAYKKVFETHFIRKFYMREIGFETLGLFKFQLETWLIINMPYFNKIFESELMKYDPLGNTKVETKNSRTNTKDHTETKTTTDEKSVESDTVTNANRMIANSKEEIESMNSNSESKQVKDENETVTDDNFNRQLESENPDSRLSITGVQDGVTVIEYAKSIKENTDNETKSTQVNGTNTGTEASRVDSANKGTSTTADNLTDNTASSVNQTGTKNDSLTSSINDVEDYIGYRTGKIGVQSFSKMLQEYRGSLLRVENQIFDEMNQLFMLVY